MTSQFTNTEALSQDSAQLADDGSPRPNRYTKLAQDLATALEALDLSELDELAEALDSRKLRRIHRSLAKHVEAVQDLASEVELVLEELDDVGSDEVVND